MFVDKEVQQELVHRFGKQSCWAVLSDADALDSVNLTWFEANQVVRRLKKQREGARIILLVADCS